MNIEFKLNTYYFTAVLSLIFALAGFSYNAWRLEVSEDNNNIRTASFEVLTELAELERIIYAAHYDKDRVEGNPRKGWVKVGLISDLSGLIGSKVDANADALKEKWSQGWSKLGADDRVAEELVMAIDSVRMEIKDVLSGLE